MLQTLRSSRYSQRHKQEIDALASISKILAGQSDQRQMLAGILGKLEQIAGFSNCAAMLLSSDGGKLIVETTREGHPSRHSDLSHLNAKGIVATVIQTGRPAFESQYNLPAGEARGVSLVCVPIVYDSEVAGTLSVEVPQDTAGELEEHARLLEIVASLIAFDMKSRRTAQRERQNLETEIRRLRSEIEERIRPENIIGNSKSMRNVYQWIDQVAPLDMTVLIRGESGTGKELVATAIHFSSNRCKGPLVRVNCATLNESLLESELFGHEKGAFAGAMSTRVGRIDEAEGGTLFLDEIGNLSPGIQAKLQCLLQERKYQRAGSSKTINADVRIIAATTEDLEASVRAGDISQDFYCCLNSFPIMLPPLRERKDDILLLANHFVRKYAESMQKNIQRISTQVIDMMFTYHWPGNVRELENCIEHATLLSNDGVIHGHYLPPTLQMPGSERESLQVSLPDRLQLLEKDMLIDALKSSRGNVAAAARRLGITSRIARYKIRNLGIMISRFASPSDDSD